MFDLQNKKVLLTGASGDIGEAIAKELHDRGVILTLSGTKEKKLNALAQELESDASILLCDLRNSNSVNNLVKLAAEKMGGIDILINNAGFNKDNLFIRLTSEDWQKVLSINLNASMLLMQGVLRGMMKQRWGRIINISSVVATTGNAGQANYVASKAGLIGMSKSVALEVASRGITVNSIAPGFISSAMTDNLTDVQKDKILANVPIGRMGRPQEIASAVTFLASSQASYITGQTIHVNGGLAMI